MFNMRSKVASDANSNLDDVANIKFGLTALGYHDDTDAGLSAYPTSDLFHSIKAFQKDNGLEVDSVVNKDGPTQEKIIDRLKKVPEIAGAFGDFAQNYEDMKEANTIGADKYFHCKANFQAASRGWDGSRAAEKLSDLREDFGQAIKGDPEEDEIRDQNANHVGRIAAEQNSSQTAADACDIFRPNGLDAKY